MSRYQSPSADTQRTKDRRQREDQAPRLSQEVPRLATLRLKIEGTTDGPGYVRVIVVETAPALFEISCMDRSCQGHHDLTREVMQALRAGSPRFQGEDECNAQMRSSSCHRVLRYVGLATYRD